MKSIFREVGLGGQVTLGWPGEFLTCNVFMVKISMGCPEDEEVGARTELLTLSFTPWAPLTTSCKGRPENRPSSGQGLIFPAAPSCELSAAWLSTPPIEAHPPCGQWPQWQSAESHSPQFEAWIEDLGKENGKKQGPMEARRIGSSWDNVRW